MVDLGHLGSIDLETLVRDGELLVRRDSKHIVSDADLPRIVASLGGEALVLRKDPARPVDATGYRTRYFDTEDLRSYRDHAMGRRRRYKVRVRRYIDSSDTFFEVKARLPMSQTEKSRWPVAANDARRLFGSGDPLPAAHAELVADTVRALYGRVADRPLLATVDMTFDRTTIFLPRSRERVTIDSNLVVRDVASERTVEADPGMHIIEVKSPGRRGDVERALLRAGIRALSVSKYCIALSVLRADEHRANRWRPAMRLLFPGVSSDAAGRDVA